MMGLAHRGWELHPGEMPLPMLLNSAGYETYLFGVQHESSDPRRLGYRQIDCSQRSAFAVTEKVVEFLNTSPREPFFLNIGFIETHRPFGGTGYDNDPPGNIDVPPYLPDTDAIRRDLSGLHGMVKAVDQAVGQIDRSLQENNLTENTIFIFTTDHGIAMPKAKGTLYDPGTKTALLVRWPNGFEGGKTYDQLLSNIDLMPTLLEAAEAWTPEGLPGRSFLSLLQGRDYQPRELIFTELTWHDRYAPTRAVRTNRFKYIRNWGHQPKVFVPGDIIRGLLHEPVIDEYYQSMRPAEELYDLKHDPHEQSNLATDAQYRRILGELNDILNEWMVSTEDPLLVGPVRKRQEDGDDLWQVEGLRDVPVV